MCNFRSIIIQNYSANILQDNTSCISHSGYSHHYTYRTEIFKKLMAWVGGKRKEQLFSKLLKFWRFGK